MVKNSMSNDLSELSHKPIDFMVRVPEWAYDMLIEMYKLSLADGIKATFEEYAGAALIVVCSKEHCRRKLAVN